MSNSKQTQSSLTKSAVPGESVEAHCGESISDEIAALLQCPDCQVGSLSAKPVTERNAILECENCQTRYPIINGIPRLIQQKQMTQWISEYSAFHQSLEDSYQSSFPKPVSFDAQDRPFQGLGGGENYHQDRTSKPTLRYSLKRRAAAISDAIAQASHPQLSSGNLNLLEAGCADGLLSAITSEKYTFKNVVGIDLQDDQLPFNPFPALQGDVQRLPLKDNSFDVVIAAALIEHLPEPKMFLKEAYRILRPNGLLAVTCPDPVFDWVCTVLGYFKYAGHLHRLSIADVVDMMNDAGFISTGGKKFMLTPAEFKPLEWIEAQAPNNLLKPFLMNQLMFGRK